MTHFNFQPDAPPTHSLFYSICPIFFISSVSGRNLDLLVKFLNTVPKQHPVKELEQLTAEFQVDETYLVPDVGVVVGGMVTR